MLVLEDLNTSGILRNRQIAKALADAGLSEMRRQVRYEGIAGVVVPRRHGRETQHSGRKAPFQLSTR